MKVHLFLFVELVSCFFVQHSIRINPTIINPLIAKSNENDLYEIDNELEKLENTVKKLKKEKLKLLNNEKGLLMLNESEIENSGFFEEEDDEDDEEFFASGIRVFIPSSVMNNNGHVRPKLPFTNTNTNTGGSGSKKPTEKKSDNFEIIQTTEYNFTNIGGYQNIKDELIQCSDMLIHYEKYKKYNVRIPKGLILEGPPGNGKTLMAKCFAGEMNISFIPVSGAQFQEKYVGVGSSRVRELFSLAMDNRPCIIFIDEIDAIGRKRSSDESTGNNSESDSTLNELLVSLDGFKSTEGIFIMAATNRADLLDSALTRPGRIDKSIYIGLPDYKTRQSIIDIHIKGKPYGKSITVDMLTEMTQGMSGAQIENLLNEAMLLAIRRAKNEQEIILEKPEIEFMFNRILVGSQSSENLFDDKTLYQIAIHEMGHAIVGLFITDYNKLIKVSLNTWSPRSPGYTLFEIKENELLNSKPKLTSHLSVLLAGRIAEEEFFGEAITTGASKDLEEVKKLAYSMIVEYGMGSKVFYPSISNNGKELIDKEVNDLVEKAYYRAKAIVSNSKTLIEECAKVLVVEQLLTCEFIMKKIGRTK